MIRRIANLVVIVATLLAACGASRLPLDGETIHWEHAVALINRGVVETVFQTHALEVSLTLENGTSVHTVEPRIDAVFEVIAACGRPCANMMVATE